MVPSQQVSVVRMRGVDKSYRVGTVDVQALKGISLDIEPGTFTVIIGPSGSGKTTLLNLVGAIDAPTAGTVELCGQDLRSLEDDALSAFRARHVGFVFQGFSLLPVLSAYENVEYPLLLVGMGASERRSRALAMLDAVGLSDQRDRRPNELSGGQKQRVAVARALVKQPDVVLADEPTANLDTRTGASIIELMHDVQAKFNTTFIFSTHDPQLMSHSDRTFAVRDGRLVSQAAGAPR
jgi:putative ABC transport system ATP-binding protein